MLAGVSLAEYGRREGTRIVFVALERPGKDVVISAGDERWLRDGHRESAGGERGSDPDRCAVSRG